MSLNIIHLQTDSIRKENFIGSEERANIENKLQFIFSDSYSYGKIEFFDNDFVLIIEKITSDHFKEIINNLENWKFECSIYDFLDYIKLEFSRKV